MSESTLILELHNRQQAWAVIKDRLFPFLREWSPSSKKHMVLTCSLKKRTNPQNRRYWGRGVLAQVAEQATSGGKLFEASTWHELFKRKFIGVIELPDGSVVGMSSRRLNTAEFSEFCEQVEAYAATELGVCFVDLEPH